MSLLKQAIVDAANLKNAALKNAEQMILEKYSTEVKSAVDNLLEQEEGGLDLGGAPAGEGAEAAAPPVEGAEEEETSTFEDENLITPSYMEGEAVSSLDDTFSLDTPDEGDTIDINISPEELAQFLQDANKNSSDEIVDSKIEDFASAQNDDQVQVDLSALADLVNDEASEMGLTDDEVDIDNDELERMVAEALEVDYEPHASGMSSTGLTEEELETAMDMAMAKAMSDEMQEENDELQSSLKKLEEEVTTLKSENKRFKTVTLQLKDKLEESIVTNAKLLYSNRVLINASLNERQKNQIVEAITNAHSVEEAKTIYETLQGTVRSNTSSPQSLGEALTRQSGRTSILPRRKSQKDNLQESAVTRMQRLAGIK